MRFHGIHPFDGKSFTNSKEVEILPITAGDEYYISLTQHIGAPAKPIVTKGQSVQAGELIAEANGFISANIHASVSGTIVSIGYVDYPVSGKAPSIVIKASEEQGSVQPIPKEATSLADIAKLAGIVGMGGAMFPAHVKLSPKSQLDTLIINGAECEPFLTCDHRTMVERAADIIAGAKIIKDALNIERVVIGVEGNKPDAIDELLQASDDVEVVELPQIYPQGGEKQLIQYVLGKVVPEGKLPADIGVLVHNVTTVCAIFDAYKLRIPCIRRVVTITGRVQSPKNILAPLGTPISRLIEFCGGTKDDNIKVILGGPMTGFAAHSLSIPTYKGMNGVVVMSGRAVTPPQRACIRCGRCARACPANLSPVTLENFAANNMYPELLKWKLLSCIECSACNYVCPSARPLKTLFRLAKKPVMELLKR